MCQTARRPATHSNTNGTGAVCARTAMPAPSAIRIHTGRPVWILIALGAGIAVLAHTAPVPFVLEWVAGRRAVWHMPRTDPPTVYLTYDDGPNPTTTPDLLDVLEREQVR